MKSDDESNHAIPAADAVFLKKRKRLIASWPFMGIFLLLVLVCVLAWINHTTPSLVNPQYVASELAEGRFDQAKLEMSAIMLPVLSLFVFGVVGAFIFIFFGVCATEKRYQKIIDRITR